MKKPTLLVKLELIIMGLCKWQRTYFIDKYCKKT